MSVFQSARAQWLAHPRKDLLAGTVVALALIPEAIAFSIIAGVDPAVGLYASVVIAIGHPQIPGGRWVCSRSVVIRSIRIIITILVQTGAATLVQAHPTHRGVLGARQPGLPTPTRV